MYKTYNFDGIPVVCNDFIVPVKNVPLSEDINTLRAYTDSTCSTPLPIDITYFISSGVVYVKISNKYITDGTVSFYLDFNGGASDIDTRLDVWSGCSFVGGE